MAVNVTPHKRFVATESPFETATMRAVMVVVAFSRAVCRWDTTPHSAPLEGRVGAFGVCVDIVKILSPPVVLLLQEKVKHLCEISSFSLMIAGDQNGSRPANEKQLYRHFPLTEFNETVWVRCGRCCETTVRIAFMYQNRISFGVNLVRLQSMATSSTLSLSADSDCREGGVCVRSDGAFTQGARLTHAGALRTFRHMGVGCVTGAIVCGALSLSVMSRPVIPLVAILSVAVGALCGIVSGSAIHALRSVLWEGPALHRAVQEENLQKVQRLSESGMWIDVPDAFGRTALMCAAWGGYKAGVTELLDQGAGVDCVDLDGATSLVLACEEGNVEIADMLVERGADCNKALTHAVCAGYCEQVVKLLIGWGGNPDHVDGDGWPLLVLALRCDRPDLVKVLLERGADLGRAIGHALPRDRRVADELIKHGSVREILRKVVVDGRADVVRELLDRYDTDIDERYENGRTLLSLAVGIPGAESRPGGLEIVEMLLDRDADPDPVDDTGSTPLVEAIVFRHWRIVRKLVARAVNVDRVAKGDGNTPFTLAVCCGCPAVIIRELAEQGALLNHVMHDGDTVLLHCVHMFNNNRMGILKVLLECGVDVDCVDRKCNTPLIIAIKKKKGIVLVRQLLASGAEVDCRDSWGDTPLAIAACGGDLEVVKELIENGADLNVRSGRGFTPLMRAAHNGHLEVVRELLKRGSPPDTVDCRGRTALFSAIEASEGLHIVRELIKHGAHLNLPDKAGVTPIAYALQSDRSDIVEELAGHGARPDLPDQEKQTLFDRSKAEGTYSRLLRILERVRGTKGACNVSPSQ